MLADAALVDFVVQPRIVCDAVVRPDMLPERLLAVAYAAARASPGKPLVALPDLVPQVLAVLVPLPVILAAEGEGALGAAVGLLVALKVFSGRELVD